MKAVLRYLEKVDPAAARIVLLALGQAGRTQTRPAGPRKQLRSAIPRHAARPLPAGLDRGRPGGGSLTRAPASSGPSAYRPDPERQSHYVHARLPDQFDAVLHFDVTRAVEPLEITAEWEAGEVLETFPFAV